MADSSAQDEADTPHRLNYDQPVPRSLAHRATFAEVYVSDTAPAGADDFLVAIQIPRAHSLWFDRLAAYHDPLSAVEAIRQALTVVSQRYLGMPPNAPASMQHLEFSVEDLSAFRDNEESPLQGIVRIRPVRDQTQGEIEYNRNLLVEATLVVDTAQALTLRGGGVAFTRETYEELRELQQSRSFDLPLTGDSRLVPVDPLSVGRRDARNVVIASLDSKSDGANAEFALLIDRRHPFFFEHPYDHVPASLFLEAARQVAIVAATRSGILQSPVAAVTGASISFSGFAELNSPIGLSPTIDPNAENIDVVVEVRVFQFSQQIATARIETFPLPDGQ
jgi:hypothetical protein